MGWSTTQYRGALTAYQQLIEAGWQAHQASAVVHRALARVAPAGFGIKPQVYRIDRTLPGMPQRQQLMPAGGRCVVLQMVPGQEEQLLEQINNYRTQGWDVTQTTPYGAAEQEDVEVWYACPPGATPGESQSHYFEPTQFSGVGDMELTQAECTAVKRAVENLVRQGYSLGQAKALA